MYAIKWLNSQNADFRDGSIFYARKSIEVSSEYGPLRIEATGYETIGSCYLDSKLYDSAYFYLNKSLKIRRLDDNAFGVVSSLSKLGLYYLSVNDYRNAEKTLVEALEISKTIGTGQLEKFIYEKLSVLYHLTNRHELAYLSLSKHYRIKDSLLNEKKTKELTQLSMLYELDKKQEEQALNNNSLMKLKKLKLNDKK